MAKHKYRRGTRIEQPCAQCGKVISLKPAEAKEGICCSLSCSSKLKAAKQGKKVKPMQAFCLQCGVVFRPKPRTDNVGRYCSRPCAYKHRGDTKRIVSWIRSLGAENRERRKKYEQERRRKERQAYVFQGPVRPISGPGSIATCRQCESLYVRTEGRQRFCSAVCVQSAQERFETKKLETRKKRRRKDKAWRKAKARAAHILLGKAIDPFEIFERDRWRCMLCGVKTPRHKRGSYEPNAPELDHIVPLSRGGSHLPSNLQCSCRACNMRKGDKPMGQLGLSLDRPSRGWSKNDQSAYS